jgi:hypothetical protein
MGLVSRSSNIKLKASSARAVNEKKQELLASKLREFGLISGGLASVELRSILQAGDAQVLFDYLSRPENLPRALEFLRAMGNFDTQFAKDFAQRVLLPGNASAAKEILAELATIGKAKTGTPGMDEFLVPLLGRYLDYAAWDKDSVEGLPAPFNYYWLSRAAGEESAKVMETMSRVITDDMAKGTARNTKIAYGFLLHNANIGENLQSEILEQGLAMHKNARDSLGTSSPFAEFLSYAFEYAPIQSKFDDIMRDTFPIFMDPAGEKVGYRYKNYAFEDLAIVSNLFYNGSVPLEKREALLDGLVAGYGDLSEKITQLPLNQFFENLNFSKITPEEEKRTMAIADGIADPFQRSSILQSIARNRHLGEETLAQLYRDNPRDLLLAEGIAKNPAAGSNLLETLEKKGSARVRRFAAETNARLLAI